MLWDTKRCSRCGEVKAVAEFHKQNTSKDGYRGICKKCRSETENVGYKEPTPEGFKRCTGCKLILPATHKYFYKHSAEKLDPKCRECSCKRYRANRDRYLKTRREKWSANAEEINKKRREEYWKDPEKVLQRNRAWNHAHQEDVRRHKREYYWADENRREKSSSTLKIATGMIQKKVNNVFKCGERIILNTFAEKPEFTNKEAILSSPI
jgi:hypothetical protein